MPIGGFPIGKLRGFPGYYFVVAEGCRFGLRHPITGGLVKKGWRFLTNAPYAAGELVLYDTFESSLNYDVAELAAGYLHWSS